MNRGTCCRKLAASFILVTALTASPAFAASWGADVGDAQLRSDIEILAAAGVIDDVTQQWPLPWGNIVSRLHSPAALGGQPAFVAEAATRVLARAASDTGAKSPAASLDVDLASAPSTIRGFDALGRQDAQGQIVLDYAGTQTAVHLAVGVRTTTKTDHQELVLDGTYLSQRLGDAVVYAGYVPHWWGPGWNTALSLSNNARPFPSVGFTRAGTAPFHTPWLSWIGPWQAEFFVGVLDGKRIASNTLFNGLRVSINPLPGLELALDRTEQSCGTGHPCEPVAEFFNVQNDPIHPSKSKDETNFDLRYTNMVEDVPFAFYAQVMDRDTGPFVHSDSSHLFGASVWLPLGDAPIRFTAEYANTISTQDFFSFGKYIYGTTYTDSKYTDGWQYRGVTLGSSLGTDSRLSTIQASFTGARDITYTLTYDNAAIGSSQPGSVNIVTIAPVTINMGEMRMSLPLRGFMIDLAARIQDDQPRPDRGWLVAVETRLRVAL